MLNEIAADGSLGVDVMFAGGMAGCRTTVSDGVKVAIGWGLRDLHADHARARGHGSLLRGTPAWG